MRGFVLLVVAGVAACESFDSPIDAVVTLEPVEGGHGLEGTIDDGVHLVRFEVVVGAEIPRIEGLGGEDVPTHEVDARFLDENGSLITMQIGGHSVLDSSWLDALTVPTDVPRETLLLLLPLAAWEAAADGAPDMVVDALFRLADSALDGLEVDLDTGDFEEMNEEILPPGTTYRHRVYRKKKAAWNLSSSIVGEHSSLYVYIYKTSGSLLSSYYTCNHGTCANSSSMSTYQTNDYTSAGIVAADRICTTSWGLTSGTHTCNDDTLAQLYTIQAGAAGSWSTCGDSTLRKTAP